MANNEDSDLSGVPHSEHLTFVDRLRAKVRPIVDRAETGEVTYPRREFLSDAARRNKEMADAAAAARKGR